MIISTSNPFAPGNYETIKIVYGFGFKKRSIWKRIRMDITRNSDDAVPDNLRAEVLDEALNELTQTTN